MPHTVNAGRAAYAYQCVQEVLNDNDITDSEYKSYVKSLPLVIKANGLCQALAFCAVKAVKNPAYRKISSQIRSHLVEQGCLPPGTGDLLAVLVGLEPKPYFRCTLEVLRLFTWLRRFAEEAITENEPAPDDLEE